MTRTLGLFSFFMVALVATAEADSLYSRNLDCDKRFTAREFEICKALERELEWVWSGHAIISPSYRTTFESACRVFCTLPISARDTRSLVLITVSLERQMTGKFADTQLANGSRFLLNMLGNQALGAFPAPERDWDQRAVQIAQNLRDEIALNIADPVMIWNPKNPQYILRVGCK